MNTIDAKFEDWCKTIDLSKCTPIDIFRAGFRSRDTEVSLLGERLLQLQKDKGDLVDRAMECK